MPGAPTPHWVTQAETIEDLARAIGMPCDVLASEVARYNGFADSGEDSDFGRGTVWFEGLSAGGPTPQRNMSRIERAPFYATRLRYGIFGTIGGLLTNGHGQVLRPKGELIEGLYAVGNVAAGALGQTYPGGGSSLGPNITFGYLAGQRLASDALAPGAMAADIEIGE